jgi:hypothetical protein
MADLRPVFALAEIENTQTRKSEVEANRVEGINLSKPLRHFKGCIPVEGFPIRESKVLADPPRMGV